jgi:AraC-like DNA-binding protein
MEDYTMEATLKFILEELSLKYGVPITISQGEELFTFPKDETCLVELQAALTKHSPNFEQVDYFQYNGHIYSSFDCHFEDKPFFAVLIGPKPIQNLVDVSDIAEAGTSSSIINSNLIQRKEFITFIALVHNLLKKTPLPTPPEWLNSEESLHEIYHLSKSSIESRRFTDSFEDSVELEKRYLDAIRRNEPRIIEWIIKKIRTTYTAQLSSNKLESVKFKFVAIITLLTRISINSGISAIRAYSLSDSLIKSLEKARNLEDCIHFITESSYMFIELIHHFPYTQKSDMVKKILYYIDSNIYNKITIEELSNYVGRHKTYISSNFKKEMKKTIHGYINEKKIFEAKHLLMLTHQSYKEIASKLNFSSQSHFIHIFKKIEGISPAQYRLKNNLNFMIIE